MTDFDKDHTTEPEFFMWNSEKGKLVLSVPFQPEKEIALEEALTDHIRPCYF